MSANAGLKIKSRLNIKDYGYLLMRDIKGRPDEPGHQLSWVRLSFKRSKDLDDAIEPIQMMLKAV